MAVRSGADEQHHENCSSDTCGFKHTESRSQPSPVHRRSGSVPELKLPARQQKTYRSHTKNQPPVSVNPGVPWTLCTAVHSETFVERKESPGATAAHQPVRSACTQSWGCRRPARSSSKF